VLYKMRQPPCWISRSRAASTTLRRPHRRRARRGRVHAVDCQTLSPSPRRRSGCAGCGGRNGRSSGSRSPRKRRRCSR
jgi:hypothetical protein